MKKDWKLYKGSRNNYGETIFFKKDKRYVILTGDKLPKDKSIKLWRVQLSTPKFLTTMKEFKTKTSALNFAKKYMEKH